MFTIEQVLGDRDALARLINEHRILTETIEQSPVHFCVYDPDDRLIAWNTAYEANYPDAFAGRSREEMQRMTYGDIIRDQVALLIPAEEVEAEVARRVAQQRSATGEAVVREYKSSGFLKVIKYPLPSGAIAGMAIDINELKHTERALEDQARALEQASDRNRELALHDPLTGLPNRRYLDDHLGRMIAQAAEAGDEAPSALALLHLDLDRFKPINDSLGHAAGDHMLCHVAGVLRGACRPADFVARVGGDEFVILLETPGGPAGAAAIARRIISEMGRPVPFEDQVCRIGVSIGVALASGPGIDAGALMSNADAALYQAKRLGRNRVEFFTDALQAQVADSKVVADEILAALDRREFFPVYQPQFFAGSLDLRGIETLCRWRHPERGVLAPDAFLGVADELNVMAEIDRVITAQVHADLAWLQDEGVAVPRVSFNVGPRRLLQPDLAAGLAAIQALGVGVTVELLESMSLDAPDATSDWALDALREHGVRVEIDDFGSCRASIVGLMSVAPDAMKIDRRIVLPVTRSERHLRLVRAIVEIGRSLDIEIVAEGIETPAHADLLRDLGATVLQGFALARPMPRDALPAFLGAEAWRRSAGPHTVAFRRTGG